MGLASPTSMTKTFSRKGGPVKLSRRFSWNKACIELLSEYHALKMFLEGSMDMDTDLNKPDSVLSTTQDPTALMLQRDKRRILAPESFCVAKLRQAHGPQKAI